MRPPHADVDTPLYTFLNTGFMVTNGLGNLFSSCECSWRDLTSGCGCCWWPPCLPGDTPDQNPHHHPHSRRRQTGSMTPSAKLRTRTKLGFLITWWCHAGLGPFAGRCVHGRAGDEHVIPRRGIAMPQEPAVHTFAAPRRQIDPDMPLRVTITPSPKAGTTDRDRRDGAGPARGTYSPSRAVPD